MNDNFLRMFLTAMSKVAPHVIGAFPASSGAVQAAPTTFEFNGADKGSASITKVVDGITMTISNFVAGPISGADSDGIAIYCHGVNYSPCDHGASSPYLSFQMAFDKNARLLSDDVSFQDDTADSTTT